MNISSIIALIFLLILAVIPAVIASKKYYSGVGFYIYGVLGFLPALIHVLCLPDRSKGDLRKASAGSIVWGALAGIFTMYKVLIDFVEMLSDIEIFGIKGIGAFWIIDTLVSVALGIWLLVCVFKCDRDKGIMMNFIASAVVSLIAPIISIIIYSIGVASSEKISLPFGQVLMREITVSWTALAQGAVLCAAFLVFALFIYRMNAGKSIYPKALYCLVPGIVVAVMSSVLLASTISYAGMTALADNSLNFFRFFFVGAYLWAVSNMPSNPVVAENVEMEVQQ
ncbi:hypothetical protein [Butyrivibrio sp. XPD2006]|uniref:hypothetical protein n=1 Tax=Butyrivibrio sp. XPD2006 TaxID=1280668 RepID=UPI0003B6022E|nr:hypothetical protein [Butyrivibrio sp. XPD2006]